MGSHTLTAESGKELEGQRKGKQGIDEISGSRFKCNATESWNI